MATLDTVKQMKQSGFTENEIIQNLQDQGISPREINDSISQSKIKEAIGNGDNQDLSEMEPSLINQQTQPPQQYSEQYAQETPAPPYPDQTPYPDQQQVYPDQQMQYPDYQQSYGISTDTMAEIANQITTEKTSKINRSLAELSDFKSIIDSKVEKIDQRIQRIESIIDQLQTSLIRKSSDQIQNLEDIKTEMKTMQASFGKVINPLVDKAREEKQSKTKANKK